MRARIGVSVILLETRREAIISLATEADRPGYDGFFMPETWAFDMTVLLAEALTVFGTPSEARRRLARWHAAGAAMPVMLLRPNLTPAQIALTLDAFRPMLESAHG
ncbi:MAG TPA: hypothetical protein VGQ77_08455 [Methylomirabilota bacterium]|jgi:alkanesulfonate monooxygenase SsuD/methylene tetrahydromethanopterin reductase-like flavin-dependent oxidoreductase (luciferase family)|nr:hypothetical protein [Methylomirabilota bacterium]